MDPATVLHDDIMSHIFSFVGGGQGKRQTRANIAPTILHVDEGSVRLLGPEEAGRLQFSTVARVCKSWQNICKENMPLILGPLRGTFNTLGTSEKILKCMRWMIEYKLRVGSLYFYTHQDVSLVTQLLKECDTTDLQKMAVNLDASDKTTDFHNVIAEQCPNLRELFMTIQGESLQQRSFSQSLFTMPSIRWLHINLLFQEAGPAVVHLPVLGLINLKEVRLSNKVGSPSKYKCLAVRSDTLEDLDVRDLGDWAYVRCDCPKLKSFSCKGKNGTIPNQPVRTNPESLTSDGTRIVTAGQVSFVGMNVPPTCRISLNHYWSYSDNSLARGKATLMELYEEDDSDGVP